MVSTSRLSYGRLEAGREMMARLRGFVASRHKISVLLHAKNVARLDLGYKS